MASKKEEAVVDCSLHECKLSPPVLSTASKVRYDVTLASITVTNFPFMEEALEAFCLWKIHCLQGSGLFCILTGAKERRSCLLEQ